MGNRFQWPYVSHSAVFPCRAASVGLAGAPNCCKLDADHGLTNEIQGYLYGGREFSEAVLG